MIIIKEAFQNEDCETDVVLFKSQYNGSWISIRQSVSEQGITDEVIFSIGETVQLITILQEMLNS